MSLFLLKEGYSLQLVIVILTFSHPRDCASLCKCSKRLRDVLSEHKFIWNVYANRLPFILNLTNGINKERFLEDVKNSMNFPSYKSLCIMFLDFNADLRFSIFHGCDSATGTLWFMQLRSGKGLEFTEIQGKDVIEPQKLRLEIGRSCIITYNEINKVLLVKKIKSTASRHHLTRTELIRFSCGSFKLVDPIGKCMLHMNRLVELRSNESDMIPMPDFIPPVQIINSVQIPQSLHLKILSEPQLQSFTSLNQAGIFASEYGSHGIEFIQLSCHSTTSSSDRLLDTAQFGSLQLQGLKLTGDPNIKAGRLSFCIDLNNQVNKADVFSEAAGHIHDLGIDHDFHNISLCASGFGQLNIDPLVWNPFWSPCTFVLYSSLRQHLQRFSIIWHGNDGDWFYRYTTNYSHISDVLPSDFSQNHV